MASQIKSKQGCWTCKLRKKKCDERRAQCDVCQSLSITCYGYGPKPEWMDGGNKERAVATSLKDIVKHTSRRKAAFQSKSMHHIQVISIAPRPTDDPIQETIPLSISRQGIPEDDTGSSLTSDSSHPIHFAPDSLSQADPLAGINIPFAESILLMHFIDVVFALHFPMYKPSIEDGGRGWFLALLFRTRPLYHAASALSALHRRTSLSKPLSSSSQATAFVQEKSHLGTCMRLINEIDKDSCPSNGLGIVITVLHLTLFEFLTGNTNGWKTHLRAAVKMHHDQGIQERNLHYGMAQQAWDTLKQNLPLLGQDPIVIEYVTGFRFMESTLIWLDIISSITAGTKPFHHRRIIAHGSQTRLGDIMGCENCVMLQIGRIAEMNHNKNEAIDTTNFDCTEIMETAVEITESIKVGLTSGRFMSQSDQDRLDKEIVRERELVTRFFALSGLVYLHLVARGYQNLELLDIIISDAVKLLQAQIKPQLLSGLVTPLFLIGCVARERDHEIFRSIFSSQPLLNPYFRERETILPILEKTWTRRQTNSLMAWQDTLDLTKEILLI